MKNRHTVGIIGLGLLGGSLAKALKCYTSHEVVGYARRIDTCKAALACKAVDKATTDACEVAKMADILVLALPPDTNGEIFKELAVYLRPGTLVTDVASTKGPMLKTIYKVLPENCYFVSIHPMAGSEQGGFERSSNNLFKGATWIVLEDKGQPCYEEEDAQLLSEWGYQFGSVVQRISMSEHDGLVASVSHMPHMVSSMISTVVGNMENADLGYRISAGGFRDITRVAGGNPAMWREIIYGNAEAVESLLDKLEVEIKKVRTLLNKPDEGVELQTYLEIACAYRENYQKIKESSRELLD